MGSIYGTGAWKIGAIKRSDAMKREEPSSSKKGINYEKAQTWEE